MKNRCPWAKNELSIHYHDVEWGVPVYDDETLFEFIVLEGAQAGLSWDTVLRKREHYREVFDGFDPVKIARYTDKKIEKLLADPGIIRNRLKVNGTVKNAKAFLAIQKEFGSFSEFAWGFVNGKPIVNEWTDISQLPATSAESDAMAKALKKRGFTFMGTTICYAHMQATGMINDHLVSCPRHKAVKKLVQK